MPKRKLKEQPSHFIPINEEMYAKTLKGEDYRGPFRQLVEANLERVNRSHPNPEEAASMTVDHWMKYYVTQVDGLYHLGLHIGNVIGGYLAIGDSDGMVTPLRPSGTSKRAEISFWIAEDFKGQGRMALAAKAVTHYAISVLGFDEVMGRTLQDNISSKRTLRNAGFVASSRWMAISQTIPDPDLLLPSSSFTVVDVFRYLSPSSEQ